MIASEVMMECPVVLRPEMTISEATVQAATADLDVLPVVDSSGYYQGAVAKAALVDASAPDASVSSLCCGDAIVCGPEFAIEHLNHDAATTIPHRTVVVVDDAGRFHGVVPQVHWAVDEAKVQSGHPRAPLEVRSYSMHLIWRCLNCGHLTSRNDGTPSSCPNCGANSNEFALHTED